jgi:hypothetical protein
VAEFQRRGAIPFHAVIRLDAATECRCQGCLASPPEPFTATLLEDGLRQEVPAVRVPCPPWTTGRAGMPVGGTARRAQHHDGRGTGRGVVVGAGGRLRRQVRDKATESFGSGLDRRLTDDDLDGLDGLPAHVAELVRACWDLGGRSELEGSGCGRGRTCWGSGALVDQEPPGDGG